jgi:membrane protein DedA with SNARE-associated domain
VTKASSPPVAGVDQGVGRHTSQIAAATSMTEVGGLSATIEHWVAHYGYAAVFVLMLVDAACIPFPSEVTMLVGGLYASQGRLEVILVGAMGTLGSMAGSWLAYAVGATVGRGFIERYGRYVFIRAHEMDRVQMWWDNHGQAAAFFGRLLPVVRTFISLPAGIARMPFWKFTAFTLLGVAIWAYAFAYLGDVLGRNWEKVTKWFRLPTLIIIAVLVAGAVWWYLQHRRERAG